MEFGSVPGPVRKPPVKKPLKLKGTDPTEVY